MAKNLFSPRRGSRRVFSWSLSSKLKVKNQPIVIITYKAGIGAKPGIPKIEIADEIRMSARIAA